MKRPGLTLRPLAGRARREWLRFLGLAAEGLAGVAIAQPGLTVVVGDAGGAGRDLNRRKISSFYAWTVRGRSASRLLSRRGGVVAARYVMRF